jgi:hypothetical protein
VILTPYEISIVMNYVCTGNEWKRMDAPAFPSTIQGLIELGLIEKTPEFMECNTIYHATEKAQAYVHEGLCNVPMPSIKWVFPEVAA